MNRKLIVLVIVVVIAAAGVGGYAFLSGGLPIGSPGGGQSLISLESVGVVGDSKIKATWRVFNPSDVTVGLTHLTVRVDGSWNIPPPDLEHFEESLPAWTGVLVKIGGITCTDIGPGQTVLVDQNYDVFKIMEVELGVERGDPYPKGELDTLTDWRSRGGLAFFTSGGCGTGGESLCAEIEGPTRNSCGDLRRLEP